LARETGLAGVALERSNFGAPMPVARCYLEPTFFVDADHPAVVAFAHEHAGENGTPLEQAVELYYVIRDGFRYNPWGVRLERSAFRASSVLARERSGGGHCIDKANVLAASCRALGIPSRLHFADVRNHIGTAKLEKLLGTDLLVYHGYAELFLNDRWVAATPAFNRELCEHLGVTPLEFNGLESSIFQEYDPKSGRFMEYVTDHGHHADIPYDTMLEAWRIHYGIEGAAWPTPPE
jgi:transglutaminase-like putative cysteine protease